MINAANLRAIKPFQSGIEDAELSDQSGLKRRIDKLVAI